MSRSYACFVFGLLSLIRLGSCTLKYNEGTFTQVLDHFNFNIDATFTQRYLYSDEYWDVEGPIVVYTGNEGDVESYWSSAGFVFEIAQQLNGYILFLEHRYYGKSLPFGNKSFDADKVGYLSLEQVLADYAVILQDMKTKLGRDSPVIAVGGSYGGMISAYMRFKYPNVVTAALAASAPIYMIAGISNNHSFWEIVTADFAQVDANCPSRVRSAFIELQKLRNMGQAGLKIISEKFSLCKELESDDQVDHLIGWIRNAFAMMCMGDYPYPAKFLGNLPGYPVNVAAHLIMNADDSLEGLVKATGLLYNGTNGTLPCFDPSTEYVACADPTGCGLGSNSLAWDYQVCTEFYLACGTNNVTDMFAPLPWTLDMRDNYCKKKWGVTQRPGWLETFVWGKSIGSASNIIFSNGDLDPWKDGGVSENLSETLIAILIKGGAHHLDLRATNPKDPPSVTLARIKEIELLKTWIYNALETNEI